MDNKFNRNSLSHKVPNLHNFPPRNLNSIAILLLLFFYKSDIISSRWHQWFVTYWHFNDKLIAGGRIGSIKGMSPGSATLYPPQTTSRLASLANCFFFHPRRLFSPFFCNAEPGPRRFFLSMEINCIKCPEKQFKTCTEFFSRTDLLQKTHLRWRKLKHLR